LRAGTPAYPVFAFGKILKSVKSVLSVARFSILILVMEFVDDIYGFVDVLEAFFKGVAEMVDEGQAGDGD
jgi:hypothetical protein